MKICKFCYAAARSGQGEQLSKCGKKFITTTYKPYFWALFAKYISKVMPTSPAKHVCVARLVATNLESHT